MADKEIKERADGMLRSFDDKIDAATHAAMAELGLSAREYFGIACEINDYLTQAMQYIVASDEGAECDA